MKHIAFLYLLKRDQMLIILYTVSFNASDVNYDLTFKKIYVNMAYFTCWDYESVTSLPKKKLLEMDGMCCLFAPFPNTQVEKN